LLVMTATVTPPAGVPALQRVDPADRLADYEVALRFYLGLPDDVIDRLVFAENSDSDIAALERAAERHRGGKDVELLSFDGLDYPVEHGRAVGEVKLIDTALSRSRLLRDLGDHGVFWKVTGRLRFKNLPRLVAGAPAAPRLYADFRRHPRPWVDLRVFASTPAAFRELILARVELLRQDEIDRSAYSAPEELLFADLLPEPGVTPRLRAEPVIEGFSGFGEDYARGSRRLWTIARAGIRRVAPRLWL
jgi:hypothetical protein